MKSYNRRAFSRGVHCPDNLMARRMAAVVEAERALSMDLAERKRTFCFVSKFKGKWGDKFEWPVEKGGDIEEDVKPLVVRKKKADTN